ncbi:hypothetical protein RI129_005334 [Pyrocoelia pectoralis]|uniref:Inosine/uridine-preferring nucleoside hydrolase domain-containing protein n=1 Tax=Pyrocoelia pectoralis TaxID=417401 RepID=A0AAN7VDZ7_9COLE
MMEPKQVIVDTDPGIDDLHAILIFLAAEKRKKVKIEAITVSVGNTNIENGCKNLVRLLEKAKRTDIPVYKGASSSLLCDTNYDGYFGKDGLGDMACSNEPDLSIVGDEPSPLAMKRLIESNPGKISLVCLGPLTNIAIASKIYENMFVDLKELFILGGTCKGKGNVNLTAEFNFHFDPESVHSVLKSVTCPTTILPFEPCSDVALPLSWRFDILPNITPEMQFMTEVEQHFFKNKGFTNRWNIPDGFLALIILYPDAILHKEAYHMTIELHGNLTRGQCIVDHMKSKKTNVFVVEKLSKEFLADTLLEIHGSD